MKDDEDDPGHPGYWQRLLAESGAPFEAIIPDRPSLSTLRDLYSHVLRAFAYACAMTGRSYGPPHDFLHEELEIVPIRPLTMGGVLHVDNFLCLSRQAALAFRSGHVGVGPELQLLADLSRIDPELLERLNPAGRLSLPDPALARPDARALEFHCRTIFLGRR